VKWFPPLAKTYPGTSATYQTTGNQVYCNNKGGYGFTRGSNNKVTGVKCDCNSSTYGTRCEFNVVKPRNCVECKDKSCATGCKTCALYNPDIPVEYQKFLRKSDIPDNKQSTLNPGNEECVFNPNATAWADVVGLACHNFDDKDSWGCNPGFADNWSLDVNQSSTYTYFNGCGKDRNSARQFATSAANKQVTSLYTGPTGNRKVYDFSEVVPDTLQDLKGPAAHLKYWRNAPNNTHLIMTYPSSHYTTWVAKQMQDHCASTGNSLGNVKYYGDIVGPPYPSNFTSYEKLGNKRKVY
jgi:hypothetical protein